MTRRLRKFLSVMSLILKNKRGLFDYGGASKSPATIRRFIAAAGAAFAAIFGAAAFVYAHSVGQVQTTKYFTPETVQMLIDRAASGTPGLQTGDIVSYIIQFTPIANGADTGVAGYITDYIPSGVEVIGASIVAKDGSGNFYDISPNLPGGIATGWGGRGQQTFLAPFDTGAYDPTGRCPSSSSPVNTSTTYTSSATWTAPSGTNSVTVEAWGGGGGGGAASTNDTGSGSGGGGGGYSKKSNIAVTPGNNYTVSVGAAGAAGITTGGGSGNGGSGGDSYFINTTTVLAKGGTGGAVNSGAVGTGGAWASGVGDTGYSGGNGAVGVSNGSSGGGGGSAGTGSDGNNAAGGTGGSAVAGGGAGANGFTTNNDGATGGASGGAGSGGRSTGNADKKGGNGASGKIILTYTYTPLTNNCNARLTELHADTGIFFSTDSRTAQYPAMPTRIEQGTNGYNINPTGAGQLNPIIGQLQATTHNIWDADQTNAFGSTQADINLLAAPKSAQTALVFKLDGTASGRGATPYNAGSAVAGPQTGYQLDNTGQIGPWQRIAYSGSRMGDNTNGPATDAGLSWTAVGGSSTSVGWNLSPSNPLPSGTTAVRWAVGKLVVGSINHVKISLRITGIPPSTGIINSSEVFGGDAGDGDDGKDNVWRYHVPSVADNNSNLYVLKSVVGYYSGSTLIPGDGSYIPVNAKIRYRTVYLNSGNANQTNVILSDTLPCQTAADSVSNITVISGSISAIINPASPAAGVCTPTPGTRQTFTFNNGVGVTLLPAASGAIEYDVQTNAASGNTVTNTATLTSAAISPGVTSNANSYVQDAPNLIITKTTSTPTVSAGGTAAYTITVTNAGTAATTSVANGLIVYDILPSDGATVDANKRFSFADGSTVCAGSITCVVPTTAVPPTLTPYNTGGNSANQQQIQWNFGGQTLAAGASFTITFNATIGSTVAASATPYYNTAVVTYYNGAVLRRADATGVAGVTVTSPLSVTKTIESYWDTGTASWVAYSNNIPVNAKVRYKIDYSNTGASAINNANITDTLPCQIGGTGMVSNVNIVSGPITTPIPDPPATVATACPATQSFSFTAGTLNAGQTGQIKFDVQTNAAAGATVINTATLSGTGAASASSSAQASVTSAPLLTIAKTASVPAIAQGGTLSYTITVTNTGTANATGMVLYDWLPSGGAALDAATRFSFVTGACGTAYTIVGSLNCTGITQTAVIPPTLSPYNDLVANPNRNNMQEIAWTFTGQSLAPGASFTVTFQASVGANVPSSTAYYNNARIVYSGQSNSGAVVVAVGSNLSTSTKTVNDLNGGDANPDDRIEYTITLRETAGIATAGVSLTDTLPATLTSPAMVTCPAGATCGFAGQTLTVSGISMAANGTAAIVFRATIATGTAAGTTIDNCAAITNPTGVGGAPCAPTLTVAASTLPGFGNKPLYFYDEAPYKLSRTKSPAGATVTINAGAFQTWTLNPTLASSVTISNTISTTVPVQLYLTATAATTVTVGLYCAAALVTSLSQAIAITATPTLFTFNLPTVNTTCAAGSSWAVRVTNPTGTITVTPYASATQISNVSLPSQDVISVTSVTPYSTAYPGVTSPAFYSAGATVYLRAVVSDPFGSYDITSAAITIKDPNTTTVVNAAAMPMVYDSGAATKTFEYAYLVPAGGLSGVWNVTVTAKEGTENLVSDAGTSSFYVSTMPSLTVVKSVQTFSDPVKGTTNPLSIPGAVMLYTIQVMNSGAGAADSGTTVIADPIPANTELYVNDIDVPGSGPALFQNGAVSSGLTYSFIGLGDGADSISFSNNSGATYNHTPVPDAYGYDSAVTNFKINFGGIFSGASGGNPSFSLKFKVRVK